MFDGNFEENRELEQRCGVKLMGEKETEYLIKMLGLEGLIDRPAGKRELSAVVRHVLRGNGDHALRKALEFKVNGLESTLR